MTRRTSHGVLRTRVTAVLAVIVAVTMTLAAVTCFVAMRASLRGQVDDVLHEQTAFVKAIPWTKLSLERMREGMKSSATRQEGALFQVVPKGREPLIKMSGAPSIPVTPADRSTMARGAGASRLSDQTIGGEHFRVLTVGLDGSVVEGFQTARTLENVDNALQQLAWILALVGVVSTALAALATWIAMRPVVAPTEEALADSIAAQRQLVADASHELRTPITSLRTNAELLTRHETLDPATRDQVARELVEQSSGLAQLVTDLLDLARDPESQESTLVRLDEVVADACDDARRLHPGVTISDRIDPCLVSGVRPELERVLRNLLENAVVHGAPADGAPIHVTVGLDHRGTLTVRDWGEGISRAEAAHIFDRFTRGSAARGRPGSGLGLAIVKQIVDAHQGTVTLEPAADGPGTVAEVRLPTSAAMSHTAVSRRRSAA